VLFYCLLYSKFSQLNKKKTVHDQFVIDDANRFCLREMRLAIVSVHGKSGTDPTTVTIKVLSKRSKPLFSPRSALSSVPVQDLHHAIAQSSSY